MITFSSHPLKGTLKADRNDRLSKVDGWTWKASSSTVSIIDDHTR